MNKKQIILQMIILAILTLFLSSCRPCPPTECPECPPCEDLMESCIDFKGFLVGTDFQQEFFLDGFHFSSLGGNLVVRLISDEVHGLRLLEDGIRIELPAPASEVSVTAGSWSSGFFDVKGYDQAGNLVYATMVPSDGNLHPIALSGEAMTRIEMTKFAGNEGLLVDVCYLP